MEIVGSNINTSLPNISQMINGRDEKKLLRLCQQQIAFGANRISMNCGTHIETEVDDMEWMVKAITSQMEIPLMVDSPNPEAISVALKYNRCGPMLVDSITCEKARIDAIMPLVKKHNALVAVLLHNENGMPEKLEERLALMPVVEEVAKCYEMDKKNMLLDSLLFPLAMGHENGALYMQCLKTLKAKYPSYSYTCGLNNISYGMPKGSLLNICFISMLLALGQEYLFVELDHNSQAFIAADRALLGFDENTMEYIGAFREEKLSVFKQEVL